MVISCHETPAVCQMFGEACASKQALASSSLCKCAPHSLSKETCCDRPAFAARNRGVLHALFRKCTEAPLVSRVRSTSKLGPIAAMCFNQIFSFVRFELKFATYQWRIARIIRLVQLPSSVTFQEPLYFSQISFRDCISKVCEALSCSGSGTGMFKHYICMLRNLAPYRQGHHPDPFGGSQIWQCQ